MSIEIIYEQLEVILESIASIVENIETTSINEVCVAMIVAIFGVAQPIMLDKTYNLSVRYNSKNILPLFERERLHRCVKYVIYLSLFSLLLYVLNLKPCFGWDNWLINNSAKLFVLFMTIILTVSIMFWFNLISVYVGDTKKLLKHLIRKVKNAKDDAGRILALDAINEIAIYAIDKQDKLIQDDLLRFYKEVQRKEEEQQQKKEAVVKDESQENEQEGAITYSDEYGIGVRNIVEWTVENSSRKLGCLQEDAVSGSLLLPDSGRKISDSNYSWLWTNLKLMRNDASLVKRFWGHSRDYLVFSLPVIGEKFDGNGTKINIDEQQEREKERYRFLNFHYAMGGLMLYSKNYEALKFMFTYTCWSPPKYELLPDDMSDIFNRFVFFGHEYDRSHGLPLDMKYSFPDAEHLGASHQVCYSICKYICLLFLRQFAIKPSLNYPAPRLQPELPDAIRELTRWEEALKKIDLFLEEVINDNELLGVLNLDVVDKKKDIDGFIEKLKKRLNDKKEEVEEKKKQFRECVRRILTESISVFDEISNKSFEPSDQDEKVCLDDSFKDILVLVFANGSVENFDLSLEGKVTNKLVGQIFDLFRRVSSQKYLLNPSDLEKGIDMVIASNKNAKIIRFNQSKETMNLGKNPKYKKQIVDLSAEQGTGSTLFILEEKDLPYFNFKDYSDDDKMKLLFSDPNSNDDTLVIGLSLDENGELREKSAPNTEDASLVLAAIGFNLEIRFKSSRNIIQIDVNSKEQGSTNKIEDIVPL